MADFPKSNGTEGRESYRSRARGVQKRVASRVPLTRFLELPLSVAERLSYVGESLRDSLNATIRLRRGTSAYGSLRPFASRLASCS